MISHIPATAPYLKYVEIRQLALAVGTTVIPVSTQDVPCTVVIIQSDNTNTGLVYVGGPAMQMPTGLQLDPGRAALFTADQSMNPQAIMASAMGHGPEQFQVYQERPSAVPQKAYLEVINLHSVYVVADTAAQWVRVVYMTYIS